MKVLASFKFEEFSVGGEIPRELHKLIVLQIGTYGANSVNHVKVHDFIIIIIYHKLMIIRFLNSISSTSVGPLPGNWLAARIADLTPDLQVLLS